MKKCKKITTWTMIFCLMIFQSSCGGNFFKELSTKTSDDARYADALKYIDAGSYDDAISTLLLTSTSFQSQTKVIQTLAGAYAGKCGQDFISIMNGLTSSTGAPLLYFMKIFTSISVSPSACYTAQLKMEQFGSTSQRTTDQNLFMFILGVTKVGTYLKSVADTSPATGVGGDGATDAGFSSCRNQTGMTDAQVAQVVSGLGLIIDNISAVSSSVSGSTAISGLTAFNTACKAATGLSTCAITDPTSSQLTTAVLDYFRELIMTSDFGVQSACTMAQALPVSGVATTCCP